MVTRAPIVLLLVPLAAACVFDTSGLAPPSLPEARAADAPASEQSHVVDFPAAQDRALADSPLDARADRSPDKKPPLDKSPDKKLAPDWWPGCPNCGCGKQCSGNVCVCKHFFCNDPPTLKQIADCAQIAATEGAFHICKLGCCTGECGP